MDKVIVSIGTSFINKAKLPEIIGITLNIGDKGYDMIWEEAVQSVDIPKDDPSAISIDYILSDLSVAGVKNDMPVSNLFDITDEIVVGLNEDISVTGYTIMHISDNTIRYLDIPVFFEKADFVDINLTA